MGTKVTKTRKFTPHSEHYHAARMFLGRAQETASGSGFQLQASLVFCAFALEAYFNFVGQKCLGHWRKSNGRRLWPNCDYLWLSSTCT